MDGRQGVVSLGFLLCSPAEDLAIGETRRMADDDALVTDALAKLLVDDPEAARDAEAAFEWLTAGEGLGVLTQERVQTFLWYGLPMKWLTDTEDHRRVIDG
jgi:hypothetical protein